MRPRKKKEGLRLYTIFGSTDLEGKKGVGLGECRGNFYCSDTNFEEEFERKEFVGGKN